jgi:hypothetical protein
MMSGGSDSKEAEGDGDRSKVCMDSVEEEGDLPIVAWIGNKSHKIQAERIAVAKRI